MEKYKPSSRRQDDPLPSPALLHTVAALHHNPHAISEDRNMSGSAGVQSLPGEQVAAVESCAEELNDYVVCLCGWAWDVSELEPGALNYW